MSTKTKPSEKAEKYSLETLRENSYELFGISSSAFDGASFGLEGEFTIDEMKKKVNTWLNKPLN